MNPFEMVVLIVAITAVASVLRARYGISRARGGRQEMAVPDVEAGRMRDEIRALKERVAVLERLATDDSSSLEREIERLRDKA
ncbi:hypothetical protein [Sphingomonas flavalba]|uniref:hypothetical protein n=1 Tax=Sphingomonas flavalba TaxID=2559804 RepID=UPI00109E0D4D|nr:hypothetical protein [Sphingomonas flavalba]